MYGRSTQNKGRIFITEQYQPVFNTMGFKVWKKWFNRTLFIPVIESHLSKLILQLVSDDLKIKVLAIIFCVVTQYTLFKAHVGLENGNKF